MVVKPKTCIQMCFISATATQESVCCLDHIVWQKKAMELLQDLVWGNHCPENLKQQTEGFDTNSYCLACVFGLRIERGGGKSKCVIVEFLHVSDNKERWWEWGRNKEACHDGSLDLKPQSVIFEREQRLILFVSAAKRTNCIWVGGSYCMNWDWNRRKWISVWSRKASFSAHIKYIV